VIIKICDKGPGIPNVELAMQEGYTTAPDHVRDMGFGAGMGLPNIKRYADRLEIDTEVGKGTVVTITVYL
jgi:anti-sigma regulatory factor (Ser/Thr protein kinase)